MQMRDVIHNRNIPLAFVSVAFAISACATEVKATPSPWVDPPTEPTPTPDVSTSAGTTRVIIHLSPVQGEGQIGSAILTSDGAMTTVEIDVGPVTGEAQPIHIHTGQCDDVGSVLHSLQNVVNGKSMTTISMSLEEIIAGGTLVNVHASYAESSTYTACGQLPISLS